MTAELWVVASAEKVRETIARCRGDAAARNALGEDFAQTYASFAGSAVPGYWNRYLTWVVVQTLAVERWPDLSYSIRDAATLVLRFLNEPDEEVSNRPAVKLWRAKPRITRAAVPEVAATMQLLATLGGAVAEARADALTPGVDPKYTEEGALYLDDADSTRILANLAALHTFFIDPPYGPRFHFWVVRQPGLSRAVRDALNVPTRFLSDLEMIFSRARDTQTQVFVLWAP